MVNITISVPQELYDKMKRHSEVIWSEVVRKALADYVRRLEIVEGGVVSSEKLAEMLKESNLNVSCVDLEKAVEYYDDGSELESKRLSTAQRMSKCPKCSMECEEVMVNYEYGGIVLRNVKALRCPSCKEELFTLEQYNAVHDRLRRAGKLCPEAF